MTYKKTHINLTNPNLKQLAERDALLQSTLRPTNILFPIAAEYPHVLSSSALENSFCIYIDNELVSHSNFIIKSVINTTTQDTFKIAMIGNVATDPKHRKQGYVRQTFSHLEMLAKNANCHAIILWSDLIQFYQKLGYLALGQEQRICLSRQKLPALPNLDLWIAEQKDITPDFCKKLLSLRFQPPLQVERSAEDFQILLTIPDTHLICFGPRNAPYAYGIAGKGYDMQGVIHEYGYQSPVELLCICEAAMAIFDSDEIFLLTPDSQKLPSAVLQSNISLETHPMALGKILNEESYLEKLYIWGLDSI